MAERRPRRGTPFSEPAAERRQAILTSGRARSSIRHRSVSPYRFKVATESSEFEGVHRLNHRTFAGEIPQHAPHPSGRLVDRFHGENTYLVALRGEAVVGMVCVRGRRPFSLDAKLPDLDALLPPGHALCEVRLLSVDPDCRRGVVFRGLVGALARQCLDDGYTLGLISGTDRQVRLYRHLGFVPFGPTVGPPQARFQPMQLPLAALYTHAFTSGTAGDLPDTFLPGPVTLRAGVAEALAAPPVSHRGEAFAAMFEAVREQLCTLTGARHVQLLLGSGTLANDAVAGQLALTGATGVVLSAGEFGERLADHAARAGLAAHVARQPWGEPFRRADVGAALDACPGAGWLWTVHCETSTGVLADLGMLRDVCTARGVRLCVDAISTLGTLAVDLRGVSLASGVSGKALGSVSGLAFVFHDGPLAPGAGRLPRMLDLDLYARAGGVPFTQSSPLVGALHAALTSLVGGPDRYAAAAADAAWLRADLRTRGFAVVTPESDAAPGIVTFEAPHALGAARVGERLAAEGFEVSYQSGYLLDRGWLQVALMGAYPRHRLPALTAALSRIAAGQENG